MQFNIQEIIGEVIHSSERFYAFLDVLSCNYMYNLDQNLVLFGQGFTAKEELAGWEYIKATGLPYKRKYVCPIWKTPAYLFPVERKALPERDYSLLGLNFVGYTGVTLVNTPGQQGFILSDNRVMVDGTNPMEVIKAALAVKLPSCSSMFCREMVNYLLFQEKGAYEVVSKMGWAEVYKLLTESVFLYQEVRYRLIEKFFMVNEIAMLNYCHECREGTEIVTMLQGMRAGTETILKVQELTIRERLNLFRAIKKGSLTCYPRYRI